jgi:hypothetical protein
MDECIINTLAYFDVFDYPLTFSEIKKYLCCPQELTDNDLYKILQSISVIQEQEGFYYFLGRNQIVEKRIERNERSFQKFAKAKIIGKILSTIPTIEYIGVSGSLSMNNASESDDIDLFFITKKNTLWITRLTVNIVLFVLQQKRGRLQKNVKDKICPNMFMQVNDLTFKKKRRTLYTGHELVQLKTLFNRNYTYELLLAKNKWVYKLFPNIEFSQRREKKSSFLKNILQTVVFPVEKFVFFIQKMYMNGHRRSETISGRHAFFHPFDRQSIILDMYELRYRKYRKLYEENIWVDRDEARYYNEEKKIRILN